MFDHSPSWSYVVTLRSIIWSASLISTASMKCTILERKTKIASTYLFCSIYNRVSYGVVRFIKASPQALLCKVFSNKCFLKVATYWEIAAYLSYHIFSLC